MDTKGGIREFLTSRRARITPEQAGVASYGPRRVPGLRREEVAVLAGVSVPYYTRLERGDINGVSDSVLDALAGALQLDDAERAHLRDLARAAQPARPRPRRRQTKPRVRPEVQWTLDAITGAAAFVSNERLDILAANQLGRALFSELYAAPARPVNTARFVFLDRRAETSFVDWDGVATETVAILRSAAGRDPYNRDLSDLIGELATQSDAFRARWAAHDVRFHNTGVKHFHHPIVGELALSYNRLDLAADHGLTIFTYTAEPGSRSEDAFKLLGSWAATVQPAELARGADQAEPRGCGSNQPVWLSSQPQNARAVALGAGRRRRIARSSRRRSSPRTGRPTSTPARSSTSIVNREISVNPPPASARLRLCALAACSAGISSTPAPARADVATARVPDAASRVRYESVREGADRDGSPASPRVVCGNHGDDLVVSDSEGLEARRRVCPLDEPDLAAALPDRVDHPLGVDDLELRMNLGALAAEVGQPAREQELPDRVAGAQP